jgi:TPP-dependent pyruvate/acetoin dehydrogenase alpha subunit
VRCKARSAEVFALGVWLCGEQKEMDMMELGLEMYRMMVRIRLCEEALVGPILSGDVKTPCHLCSGQEAVAVGMCAALGKEDYVFGNHRSHGHFLAKGGSLRNMVAEIFCREAGCSRGRGGSMDEALAFARGSAFPKAKDLGKYVFKE